MKQGLDDKKSTATLFSTRGTSEGLPLLVDGVRHDSLLCAWRVVFHFYPFPSSPKDQKNCNSKGRNK